jgi:hypothetical protein
VFKAEGPEPGPAETHASSKTLIDQVAADDTCT